MKTVSLKSGQLAVQPPRYSDDFRTAMRAIGAQWKDINLKSGPVKMWAFDPAHLETVTAAFERCYPEASAPVVRGPFKALPTCLIPAIGVVAADGHTYAVVGGGFDEMQAAVKEIDGRRWNDQARAWELLHVAPAALAATMQAAGFRLVAAVLLADEEVATIEAAQRTILANREALEAKISDLDKQISKYSYRSTSSIKAGLARDSARMTYAIQYASKALDKLTEPEIRTMIAVVRDDLEA